MLERLKIKSEFIDGLRVTDKATVEIVEMVLSGAINKEIASWITRAGAEADVRGVGTGRAQRVHHVARVHAAVGGFGGLASCAFGRGGSGGESIEATAVEHGGRSP
jgi:acetylglutamate kinase